MNNFSHVILKNKEDIELSQGFPWVYDNEIFSVKWLAEDGSGVKTTTLAEAQVKAGSAVEVYSSKGTFLGTGIFNPSSKIAVRLIGREHADKIMADPAAYWDKAVRNSVNIRALSFDRMDSCRIIYGEADFIPGLVAERYVAYSGERTAVFVVVQFLSLACEVFRKEIIDSIKSVCKPDGIYERSDAPVREKEGLEQKTGWLLGTGAHFVKDGVITINENGIFLDVDIVNGQKTGYFLDQKFNRAAVASYCHGKRVLDAFSHTGAFGLNAAKAGAKSVVCADISQEAVDLISHNAESNGVSGKLTAVCADVFDLLRQYEEKGEMFDVIILDPPAFTKSARQIQKAYGGYKEINLRAMRILSEGGILVTCSCSYYFDENTFYSMVMHAAKDSHKSVQVLQKRGAAPDHPVLVGYPQSEYLKCAVCRVL
ncbi:MAG: class I SAM-dependent rRNA methyltransferase [Treponema sp.]|nr:class I SAM-dependent rRNA methyltransferase [Treponema sp.]